MAFAPRFLACIGVVTSLATLLILGCLYIDTGFDLSEKAVGLYLSIAKWSAVGAAGATGLGMIRDIYAAIRTYLATHSSKTTCKIAREEMGLTLVSVPLGFMALYSMLVN